jgi:hypothetical protein
VEDILNIFTGVPSPKKEGGGADWPRIRSIPIKGQIRLTFFTFKVFILIWVKILWLLKTNLKD